MRHPFRVLRGAALLVAVLAIVGGAGCDAAAPTDPLAGAPLVGTNWRLVSLEPGAPLVSAAPPDRIPSLQFYYMLGPPRLLAGGDGGCNGFAGRYEATPEGAIWIDTVMATRIGCEEDRRALEAAYFERLYAATAWSVHADSLLLQSADARRLLFVRQ